MSVFAISHIVGKAPREWESQSASQKACKRASTISFLLLGVENALVKYVKSVDFGLQIDREMRKVKIERKTHP